MTPRIPLPSDELTRWGLPDTSGLAPAIGKARRRLLKVAHGSAFVDPVTTELVRMRNARHQTCYF